MVFYFYSEKIRIVKGLCLKIKCKVSKCSKMEKNVKILILAPFLFIVYNCGKRYPCQLKNAFKVYFLAFQMYMRTSNYSPMILYCYIFTFLR